MLARSSYRSHQTIPTIQLKDSEEENSMRNIRKGKKKVNNLFKRMPMKPSFRRLNETGPSPRNEYTPPSGFITHSPLVTAATKKKVAGTPMSANERTPLKERKPFLSKVTNNNNSQRIESDDSSEVCPYEPPKFVLTNPKTGQSDMQSTKAREDESQGQEFRQFVFDPTFQKIESVAVERSDPGTTDLSEFISSAAKLDMTPSSQAKKSETLKPPSNVKKTEIRKDFVPNNATDHKSIEQSNKTKRLSGNKRRPGITAEALAKQQEEMRAGPPRTVLTSSDQSVISNVSVANATIIAPSSEVFPEGHPFHSFSGTGGDDNDSDPFKIGGWLSASNEDFAADWQTSNSFMEDPFAETERKMASPTKVTTDDALIRSIKKAATRGKATVQNKSVFKPDPTPRGNKSARISAQRFYPDEEMQQIDSDTVVEEEQHQQKGCIGPQEKPPKGLPSNAILGSMIFHQAFSGGEESKSITWNSENIEVQLKDDEQSCDSASLGEIPVDIIASKGSDVTDITASSISEEASSFYEKSFDGWKRQANNVLDQWHKSKQAPNPNSYRADAPKESTGVYDKEQLHNRATVEHINMFSA